MNGLPFFELVRRIQAAKDPTEDYELVKSLIDIYYEDNKSYAGIFTNLLKAGYDAEMNPKIFFLDSVTTLWKFIRHPHFEKKNHPKILALETDLRQWLESRTFTTWKLYKQTELFDKLKSKENYLRDCLNAQSILLEEKVGIWGKMYAYFRPKMVEHSYFRKISPRHDMIEDIFSMETEKIFQTMVLEGNPTRVVSNLGGLIFISIKRRLISEEKWRKDHDNLDVYDLQIPDDQTNSLAKDIDHEGEFFQINDLIEAQSNLWNFDPSRISPKMQSLMVKEILNSLTSNELELFVDKYISDLSYDKIIQKNGLLTGNEDDQEKKRINQNFRQKVHRLREKIRKIIVDFLNRGGDPFVKHFN